MRLTRRVVINARKRGVTVYTRRQWAGPRQLSVYAWRAINRRHKRPYSDTLWQHITVTPVKPLRQAMRDLHDIGMSRFRSGVSYSAVWHPLTGEIAIGQGFLISGAHTQNDKNIPNFSKDQNPVSHAIAMLGMPGVTPSPRAVEKLEDFIAAMIEEKALTVGHDYVPHSLVAKKDCPTDAMRSRMVAINTNARRKAKRNV